MKTIKYYSLMLCSTFIIYAANAQQEYKIATDNTKDGKLVLSNFSGDFPIEGYNGNEIIISGINTKTPERAKGLKAVYASGTDNTGLGLSVEKDGNNINVAYLPSFTQKANFKIKVPQNLALKIESGCEKQDSIHIKDMKSELEINNCHSIDLVNVSGPLVLSTVSGDINVIINNISGNKPSSITTISGDVDVTLPATAAVNLEMKTTTGKIYSDFVFETPKKNVESADNNEIKTKLNGGGSDLKISDISGNIYLRKAK